MPTEPFTLDLAFEAKGVIPVTPSGRVALCTLWTPPSFVRDTLAEMGVDLSPVAAIGGLYGAGLKLMLRNLLYNPQIGRVILFGKDFSGAGEHIENFFAGRYEVLPPRHYDMGYLNALAIEGPTRYITDAIVTPDKWVARPEIEAVDVNDWITLQRLIEAPLAPWRPSSRTHVSLPRPVLDYRPSDVHCHALAADTITEAWRLVLARLSTFGRPVAFRDGKERRELLNVKVVIRNPQARPDGDTLTNLGLLGQEIEDYQRSFSQYDHGSPTAYNYGHRLHEYFNVDSLLMVEQQLSLNPLDSRHCHVTLWDNQWDIVAESSPCLVNLTFRQEAGRLDLTACFRSHNATRAWPRNCFALAHIQGEMAAKTGNEPGTLTVISHSLTINPMDYDSVAAIVHQEGRPGLELDPYGYFTFAVDRAAQTIKALHYSPAGELLDEYAGETPSALARTLYRAEAISSISHAIYVGRQLERAYSCLKSGHEYFQDNSAAEGPAESPREVK